MADFYNQANHSVILDGQAIEDFFEGDDAIAFEPVGESMTVNRGLDRNRLSFGSRRPGQLTVRLKPTSPTLSRLERLVNAQEQGEPRLFPVGVTTGVDEVLTMTNCGVREEGFQTGGPNMQPRVFVFLSEAFEKEQNPAIEVPTL